MYRDKLLRTPFGWDAGTPRAFINLGNLETLIGPLVKNFKQIDDLLADKSFNGPRLADIKKQLGAVEAQQKAALNVISGYDATALTWDILTSGHTDLAASQPSPRIASQFDSAAVFGPAIESTQGPRASPGRMDVSLAYNPYDSFCAINHRVSSARHERGVHGRGDDRADCGGLSDLVHS